MQRRQLTQEKNNTECDRKSLLQIYEGFKGSNAKTQCNYFHIKECTHAPIRSKTLLVHCPNVIKSENSLMPHQFAIAAVRRK